MLRLSLRTQLLALQLVIVVFTLTLVAVVAQQVLEAQLRDSYENQMIGVAQSVARLPAIVEAIEEHPNPTVVIQPIAELIREASGLTYVVVTDDTGLRYSHPNPDEIGQPVSTSPDVPLSGEVYIGTQTGTLGTSWRVKVPIMDDAGTIIGTASVGILESELEEQLSQSYRSLFWWILAAGVVGTLGAIWITRLAWRRIYRMEPEEIANMRRVREAMLHSLGEGVVALDSQGRIALVNDVAKRFLELDDSDIGKAAVDVLDPSLLSLVIVTEGAREELVLAGEQVLYARHTNAVVDGEVVGSVFVLRDRTEVLELVRRLDGERDLTDALRAQAHEFANRMHVVSGLIELDRSREALDFISSTVRGGTLVASAVNDETGTITDPSVRALLMAKAIIADERGVRVTVAPWSTLSDADAGRDVVVVLGNLLDNAMEATGPGGAIWVALETDDDGTVTVTVDDDGPGVDAAQRDQIFTPGVSTKRAPYGGTRGIGLALVARVVRRRGGTVEVHESSYGGARFVASLPRPRVPEPTRAQ